MLQVLEFYILVHAYLEMRCMLLSIVIAFVFFRGLFACIIYMLFEMLSSAYIEIRYIRTERHIYITS